MRLLLSFLFRVVHVITVVLMIVAPVVLVVFDVCVIISINVHVRVVAPALTPLIILNCPYD